MENGTLASFIKFLEEKRLVKFDIDRDSDECFDNRVRLQKYVYIAQRFGLDLPYKHSMYLYGPYSKTLACHYYTMSRSPGLYGGASAELPSGFDREGFLRSVKDDPKWLEIATTLIERNKEIAGRNELVENVGNIKYWATSERIAGVLDDLEAHGLVKIVTDG